MRPVSPCTWRWLEHGPGDAPSNMAIDEAIADACRAGLVPPTLRVYGWAPPAVSIGYFQSLLRVLDVERCRQMGIDVVRRLTGGQAVLHDREITYSWICPQDHPLIPRGRSALYRAVHQALVEGLHQVGIGAELADPTRAEPRGRTGNPSCFANLAPGEVTVEGKKLIGSAQRRLNGVIIQHGSILLTVDRPAWDAVLRCPDLSWHRQMVQAHQIRLIGLVEIAGWMASDLKALLAALRQGFQGRFGAVLSPGVLHPWEEERAGWLRQEKYRNPAWNARR